MIQRLKQWWPLMRKETHERLMQDLAELLRAAGEQKLRDHGRHIEARFKEQKRRLADSHEKELLALAARLDPLIGRLSQVQIGEDPVKGLCEHRRWCAVVSIDDRLMYMAQSRGDRKLAYESIARHAISLLQDQFGRGAAE